MDSLGRGGPSYTALDRAGPRLPERQRSAEPTLAHPGVAVPLSSAQLFRRPCLIMSNLRTHSGHAKGVLSTAPSRRESIAALLRHRKVSG